MDLNRKTLPYRVFLYYLVIFTGLILLDDLLPGSSAAATAQGAAEGAELQALLEGSAPAAAAESGGLNFINDRAIALLAALVGTVLFTVPLAWTYGLTGPRSKQHGSIMETIFLLPITVASVVVIVQNSIALAFSLAGIVAAVRFRSNIKTPGDAVFVFAALAIGLAAGVSELGVAAIGSMFFCFTYIVLRITGVVKDYEAPAAESAAEAGTPAEPDFTATLQPVAPPAGGFASNLQAAVPHEPGPSPAGYPVGGEAPPK